MRLVNVYEDGLAPHILWRLLEERPRENWISHKEMPTIQSHAEFVASKPFLYWYLIRGDNGDGILNNVDCVGAIECTDRNEIGVSIFRRHQRKGYGKVALTLFLRCHNPLPAIPAIRNGHWLANIAGSNIGSKLFFAECGFRPLQETFVL